MLVAHGLVSSGLFVLCNLCYLTFQTRSLYLTKGVLSLSPAMCFFWFILLAANMGAPPSVNLQREIMIAIGVVQSSGVFLVYLALLLFLSAAYCFHVFLATQHGQVRRRFLSSFVVSLRRIVCLFLHVAPVFFLVSKSELVGGWLG